jgi:Fe-S cluster assembly scaffold protein SufB
MLSAQVREPSAVVEHEASTSKIGEDQLFYFQQRGVDPEKAVAAIISGFCREVSPLLTDPLQSADRIIIVCSCMPCHREFPGLILICMFD